MNKKYLLPLILILCLALTLTGYSANLFSTYDQRIKLTIDNTKIDSDLTWFPVTVFLTSSQGEEVFAEFDADADFDRCAFTTSDEVTQIYGDCELFDDSESKAIYHIAKTGVAISNTATTDFYMYYDNDAAHNTSYIGTKNPDLIVSRDIGSSAIDRPEFSSYDTIIDKNNPSNFDGTITTVSIWASSNMTDCEVGTFYAVDATHYTSRDTQAVGAVTAGAKRDFTVSLDVEIGDYIGIYQTGGRIEQTGSGDGFWYVASGGDIPCTNLEFTFRADRTVSLYGTGTPTAGENVWDSNYKSVHHMNDATTSTILDSTSNYDGVKKAANEPVEATGKVGQGQDFDGDEYIDTGILINTDNDFTISGITKVTDKTAQQAFWGGQPANENGGRSYVGFRDSKYWAAIGETQAYDIANTGVTNDTYFHWALVADSGTAYWYLNGAQVDTFSYTGAGQQVTYANYIGAIHTYEGTGNYLTGVSDENRLALSARSAAWLKAEYNSLWDTLLTYGSEETGGVTYNAINFGMNF